MKHYGKVSTSAETQGEANALWYTNSEGKTIDLNDSSVVEEEIARMLYKY